MWSSLSKACKERFIHKVLIHTNVETSQGLRQHDVVYSEWAGTLSTVLLVITRDGHVSGRVSHTGQNFVADESGQEISFC